MPMLNYAKGVVITGGSFTSLNTSTVNSIPVFERLQRQVAPGAFHNSGERFDPPKCHPRTRTAVTKKLKGWMYGREGNTDRLLMWLNGPAGAGKSAIAQTLAETCEAEGILLASFFFSRSDMNRNHCKNLFATLAYQMACAIPETRPVLEEVVNRDPLIFTRSLAAQMLSLIVRPLEPLVNLGYFNAPIAPRLVIIDGLDEVNETSIQCNILQVLLDALQRHNLPLLFLLASRPEQHISLALSSTSEHTHLIHRLCLDDSWRPDDDIRLFLTSSFSQIKDVHPAKSGIRDPWPSEDDIKVLVRKASGQFIYASIVISFVSAIRQKPMERLEIILGLRPVASSDLPFAELDAIYMHILSRLEDPHTTMQIIGCIFLAQGVSPLDHSPISLLMPYCSFTNIEWLLGLSTGDVALHLTDMSALLSGNQHRISVVHASFNDFIFDRSRSGRFTIDISTFNCTITCHCIRLLMLPEECISDGGDLYTYYLRLLQAIIYHLRGAAYNEDLKQQLLELSVHSDMARKLQSARQIFGYFLWTFLPELMYILETKLPDTLAYRELRSRFYDNMIFREFDPNEGDEAPSPFIISWGLYF